MKIALLGYGKMGKAIEDVLAELHPDDEVCLRITSKNTEDLTLENLSKADVVIEFSRPDSVVENLKLCMAAGVPVVTGTTGWDDQMPEIKAMCKNNEGTVFFAPNFSVGVNIFFAMNMALANLMSGHEQYTPSMTEIHHTDKLDSPSGTAIELAQQILREHPGLDGWKDVKLEEHSSEKLIITSKREANVHGTHIVRYRSAVDQIEISHEAFSRRGFAEGAVLAAHWIPGKPGFHGMHDLIRL